MSVHAIWLQHVGKRSLRYLDSTCSLYGEAAPSEGDYGMSTGGGLAPLALDIPCRLLAASRTARSQVFTTGLQESYNEQAIFAVPASYPHEQVKRVVHEGINYRAVGQMPHMSGFPFRMIIAEME